MTGPAGSSANGASQRPLVTRAARSPARPAPRPSRGWPHRARRAMAPSSSCARSIAARIVADMATLLPHQPRPLVRPQSERTLVWLLAAVLGVLGGLSSRRGDEAASSTTMIPACSGVNVRTGPSTSSASGPSSRPAPGVTVVATVGGSHWSTTCPSAKSGATWYRISAINGKSVSRVYGRSVPVRGDRGPVAPPERHDPIHRRLRQRPHPAPEPRPRRAREEAVSGGCSPRPDRPRRAIHLPDERDPPPARSRAATWRTATTSRTPCRAAIPRGRRRSARSRSSGRCSGTPSRGARSCTGTRYGTATTSYRLGCDINGAHCVGGTPPRRTR